MDIRDLPSLERAALTIALDNGMINYRCTSTEFLKRAEDIISDEYIPDVLALEIWLSNLDPAVFDVVVTGEHVISKAICMSCPRDKHDQPVSNILDTIFNKS